MNLDNYIDNIKNLKPMEHGFDYDTEKWVKLPTVYKKMIKSFEGNKISRADVIEAYKSYYNGKDDCHKAFLLTMVWGFGTTGYGTHRTKKYLSEENCGYIKESIDAAQNDLKLAFETLNMIKGIGISYISKVLYFATKGAGKEEYALIFDARVARSLIKLTTPEIFKIVTVRPSSKYDAFINYNKLVHQLAKQYAVDADAIELFLFKPKSL